MGLCSVVRAGVVFDVRRACLAGGSDEDEANDDREVPLLSVSLLRLDPRLPLSWSLPLPLPLSLPLPLTCFPT